MNPLEQAIDSGHAMKRRQQRGIPKSVSLLLDSYGSKQFDGHGGVLVFFDKRSFRTMERDLSRRVASRLEEWRDIYKVLSAADGCTITMGHRTKHIRRR